LPLSPSTSPSSSRDPANSDHLWEGSATNHEFVDSTLQEAVGDDAVTVIHSPVGTGEPGKFIVTGDTENIGACAEPAATRRAAGSTSDDKRISRVFMLNNSQEQRLLDEMRLRGT
jgi:hypothetical protein